MSRTLRGLYVITDRRLMGKDLLTQAEQAILGGARLLQYRDKSTDTCRREREALALAQLCEQHKVRFIINDDPALALKTDADGFISVRVTAISVAYDTRWDGIKLSASPAMPAWKKPAQQNRLARITLPLAVFFPHRPSPMPPPLKLTSCDRQSINSLFLSLPSAVSALKTAVYYWPPVPTCWP